MLLHLLSRLLPCDASCAGLPGCVWEDLPREPGEAGFGICVVAALQSLVMRGRPRAPLMCGEQMPLIHPPCAGEAAFLLSDLLTAPGQMLTLPLKDSHGRPLPGCTATLSAEELPNTNAVVTLALAAQRLDNMDLLSKSDPFAKISKARESGAWVPVVKSEVC